jgi:hypothetical protein
MASKATDQVTKRGVNIGKSSFHLIGLEWPLRVDCVEKLRGPHLLVTFE